MTGIRLDMIMIKKNLVPMYVVMWSSLKPYVRPEKLYSENCRVIKTTNICSSYNEGLLPFEILKIGSNFHIPPPPPLSCPNYFFCKMTLFLRGGGLKYMPLMEDVIKPSNCKPNWNIHDRLHSEIGPININ